MAIPSRCSHVEASHGRPMIRMNGDRSWSSRECRDDVGSLERRRVCGRAGGQEEAARYIRILKSVHRQSVHRRYFTSSTRSCLVTSPAVRRAK